MSKKFRLLMVLVLVTGLFGGLLTASTVSADPTPGKVIEIPRIDLGDVFDNGGDWDTQIQVQNTSSTAGAWVTAVFWKTYSETCPSNNPGPFAHACMYLPKNGIWTLHTQIPDDAESALIYSFDSAANWKCTHSGWDYDDWFAAALGPDLAVTVDRWGPDAYAGEFALSASYTGVADPWMVDPGPPYEYFAPYVMNGYHNLDATITIQNSGDICASIWIYYKEQGNCEFMKAQHIELIAPGEAIRIGPGPDADMAYPLPELAAPWLGSAYITSNVPLAVIVDQLSFDPSLNQGTLLSMRGMPYLGDARQAGWQEIWYADLLYREISGWQSSIQVQNLTVGSVPTFVTVEFFDQSGDSILFVGDWVCRNGSKTFYIPAITDLGVNFPFGYVGAAEIMSHGQVDYPGDWHDGEPIFAVVDIKKLKVYDDTTGFWRHTFPGETQAGSYNAHPWWQKQNADLWFMPYIAKEQEGVTSRIAIRNNANCNKISGNIRIYDETGTEVTRIPVPWLHPKHMKIVDLAYFGQIARGFVGAATFVVDPVTGVEQLCDTNQDGITDQLPIMPSVVVLNYGYETELPIGSGAGPWKQTGGDVTRVYEGIPMAGDPPDCVGSIFGDVTVRQDDDYYHFDFVQGATVSIGDRTDTTDSTGGYQITGVTAGLGQTVTFSKSGDFFDGTESADVYCGKETQVNYELICANPLTVLVTDTDDSLVPGATVTATVTYDVNYGTGKDAYTTHDETNNLGTVTFDIAAGGNGLNAATVGTASAPGHDFVSCTLDPGDPNLDCGDTPSMKCGLCKWNTIVGTITIGEQLAAGYTLKAINMSDPLMPEVDSDVTTAAGVYSLENFSDDLGPLYRIQLWSPSNTYIGMKDITVLDHCGDTGVLTYTNGFGDVNW